MGRVPSGGNLLWTSTADGLSAGFGNRLDSVLSSHRCSYCLLWEQTMDVDKNSVYLSHWSYCSGLSQLYETSSVPSMVGLGVLLTFTKSAELW